MSQALPSPTANDAGTVPLLMPRSCGEESEIGKQPFVQIERQSEVAGCAVSVVTFDAHEGV